MSDERAPGIVVEILRAVMHLPARSIFKRVRFAVSAGELEEIRRYCLARDGQFFHAYPVDTHKS